MRNPHHGFPTLSDSRQVPPNHFAWRGQHPRAPLPATDGTPQDLAERMLKARRDRVRARTTAIRGLQLSFMSALLVGWLFLGADPLHTAGTGEDQCENVGLPMGPAAQHRMRNAIGRPGQCPSRSWFRMLCPPKPDTNAKLFPFAIRSVGDVEATLNNWKLSIRWVRA